MDFLLTSALLAASPEAQTPNDEWDNVEDCLLGAVGSVDVRYVRDQVPKTSGPREWTSAAWRGERVHGQFVLWTQAGAEQVRLSTTPLVGERGDEIPASCVRPYFVRYTLGDGKLCGDILDDAEQVDVPPRTVQPVWLSVDVPPDTKPGVYEGSLTVRAAGAGSLSFDLRVEALPNALPPPEQWAFHLDLWQNPYSVARYHNVRTWSNEHWSLLEPVLRMAAQAGQKCLTTTIVHRPWNAQTYEPFASMIKWTLHGDGKWAFDYTEFDEYVEFGAKCGLAGQINCYSMAPWGNRIHYYDADTGDFKFVEAAPGSEDYKGIWTAFLADFAEHLKERGWFERIAIAMDERPVEDMLQVVALVREVAPGLKLALAGADHKELYDEIHDYCIFIDHRLDHAMIKRRAGRGQPTTFYICCGPARPNTFTFSPPAEAAWLGWFAAAKGYGGLLRWAFNSWVRDPFEDTSYGNWPAGDCFVIYPGPRSSIRFERLREGIQDYEKIRIVRADLAKLGDTARPQLDELDQALAGFNYPDVGDDEALAARVRKAKQVLLQLSRRATE